MACLYLTRLVERDVTRGPSEVGGVTITGVTVYLIITHPSIKARVFVAFVSVNFADITRISSCTETKISTHSIHANAFVETRIGSTLIHINFTIQTSERSGTVAAGTVIVFTWGHFLVLRVHASTIVGTGVAGITGTIRCLTVVSSEIGRASTVVSTEVWEFSTDSSIQTRTVTTEGDRDRTVLPSKP